MGYDFFMVQLPSHREGSFPLTIDDIELAEVVPKLASVDEARQRVQEFSGMILNGPPGSGQFRKELPDGAMLFCDVSETCFHSNHSPWEVVLELYLHLKSAYPDLVVIDPQKGSIFDEETFRRFPDWP